MENDYSITPARRRDLPLLPTIELAAAMLLVGHAPDTVLRETTSDEEFEHAQKNGYLWVALAEDLPVGFARVRVFGSDTAHLEEVDVLPVHGRRGIGTRLVMTVCEWATTNKY
jgi:GNAT superfamily N-acetyltransferase